MHQADSAYAILTKKIIEAIGYTLLRHMTSPNNPWVPLLERKATLLLLSCFWHTARLQLVKVEAAAIHVTCTHIGSPSLLQTTGKALHPDWL